MSLTRSLVIGATILGGLLAGVAVDKSMVQLPSWRQIGLVPWAEFTRTADLGRGLIFYPAQGIGALLCSVVAAVVFGVNRTEPREAAIPIYGAAGLAILAFIVTRYVIAPDTLSVGNVDDNAAALQIIFDRLQPWWTGKASLHALTFFANVWALVALAGRR
jgi:cytochrome c biogenesis factor